MNPQTFAIIKISAGVLATIGLYSVLYKETKFYRFWEHLFLGLAAGYGVVAAWKDTLYTDWWVYTFGTAATPTAPATPGHWIWAALLPIGIMGYMVFSKKHNWMSKIPIGIILGLWSGQQVQIWWQTWGPQVYSSMQPIIPTTFSPMARPSTLEVANGQVQTIADSAQLANVQQQLANNLYPTQALTNLIFVVTFISAFSYFIFSFELKNKLMLGVNKLGRWMLMVGFGAIFGSTVMARFALVIDRMSFIVNEWVQTLTQRV
ncbi:MAG: hypothetical protein KF824_02010 [Fimbriimonadaceae bacterium]|nr:MAG: hypothetical protein KF824_02010 [Fimbriimonadaceae bacterium]